MTERRNGSARKLGCSAEFFHGSLELLEEDTSVIIFQGEDETRALTDRAESFARRVSQDVTVFDTRDYPLDGISPEFRGRSRRW